MENKQEISKVDYNQLLNTISDTYIIGHQRAVQAVNTNMVETYWKIGQYIVEFEQGGSFKAKYGKALLENLSKDLNRIHGKGFSRSNLNYMRAFYLLYPICEELPHKLSWTHFCELTKINDPLERSFYEKQSILENWSTTDLKTSKEILTIFALGSFDGQSGNTATSKTRTNYTTTD